MVLFFLQEAGCNKSYKCVITQQTKLQQQRHGRTAVCEQLQTENNGKQMDFEVFNIMSYEGEITAVAVYDLFVIDFSPHFLLRNVPDLQQN